MHPSKRKMYAILAGVGISLGAAGIASAASATGSPAPAAIATVATAATDPTTAATTDDASTTASTDDASDCTPTYTSSVTVPVAADGTEPTDAELQAVATVTSDEAIAAALANTPGTAGTAELKSVAGNVVWEVDVTATAGEEYDVIIDAGNATVLDTHVEGGHHGGHHGADSDDDSTESTDTTTG
jgi:uncharacterized membrane protein YkoI